MVIMLFSHLKGNLRIIACPGHIQPLSSSHWDSSLFSRAAGGYAASLFSLEERKEQVYAEDKAEGRSHNLNEYLACCLLCCSCMTKLQLPSGDSPPWNGCHHVALLSLVPTTVVTQQMVKQLLTPH